MSLQTTFQLGLNAAVGTAAQSKSFAYDEAQYVYSQSIVTTVGPAKGTAAGLVFGLGCAFIPCYTQKQLRSISAVQIGTGTGADNLSVYICSNYAQVFGTATAVSQLAAGIGTGTLYTTSTLNGTGVNLVTIPTVMSFTTGGNPVTGTGSVGGGTSNLSVQCAQFDNGTYSVVVSSPQGTNTQTGYVFPVGAQGGVTINPGDVIIVAKSSTDTQNAYALELEFTYTPGAYVTR
jgi:hypothetical protein